MLLIKCNKIVVLIRGDSELLKGLVHPKMKTLSLSTHPHVIPDP